MTVRMCCFPGPAASASWSDQVFGRGENGAKELHEIVVYDCVLRSYTPILREKANAITSRQLANSVAPGV